MSNMLLIAKREYLEQIRGRAFRISTIVLPLLSAALLSFSYYLDHKANTGTRFAIVADDAFLANQVRQQLLDDKDSHYSVDVIAPATNEQRNELRKLVRSKAIDGVLSIDSSNPQMITATVTSLSAAKGNQFGRLQSALNRGVINERMIGSGMTQAQADKMLAKVSVEALQLNKDGKIGKSNGSVTVFKATLMLIMLSLPIMLYGLDVARAIIEEKTSRIFEVMLAVVKPSDLLAGKLLGVGCVGITQIAIWVLGVSVFMGTTLATALLTGDIAIHFSWAEGAFFPIYFVLGFALFSAIFSGLAATCESAQDLQKFMWVAIVPLYTSMGFLPVMINDPNSAWSIAATICPLTSPYTMISRMGMTAVPFWQIALSVILLVLTIWGVLWFSSRLYRVGILMYGKRATLPEVLRWLRYS
ncbi:MAG TPA: ABC transporter permease [Terracidiphilus sp.]|nr:ABC transporter permease [Terracidiphilus sp.]